MGKFFKRLDLFDHQILNIDIMIVY